MPPMTSFSFPSNKVFATVLPCYCVLILVLTVSQTDAISFRSAGDSNETTTKPPNSVTTSTSSLVQDLDNTHAKQRYFDCPPICLCHYDSGSQHLKISCPKEATTGSPISRRKLSLTNGVRHLGINHATLNSFTIPQLMPGLFENNLVELSLHNVILDPFLLFSSDLIVNSKQSLRKIRICDALVISELKDHLTEEARVRLPYLYSLENLDSFTLCDTEPWFSRLLLNALPKVVKHISIVNSSLGKLNPETFSHLTLLETLNLTRNHILSIPWGTLQPLTRLRILDLSHNRIEHLQEEVFVGLASLHKLNVSNNVIQYVDTEVFVPLTAIDTIDISQNEVIQIFEPYFKDNVKLKVLLMSNTWHKDSFTSDYTASRSLMEMDRLIDTLQVVDTLDLRDNGMRSIPETLAHLPHLRRLYLQGNQWECTCQDLWVQYWANTDITKISIDNSNNTNQLWCFSKEIHYQFSTFMQGLNCTNREIVTKTRKRYYGLPGKSMLLQCHTQRPEGPIITWFTPRKQRLVTGSRYSDLDLDNPSASSYLRVLKNGNLRLSNLSLEEFGLYKCIASYPDLNVTHYIHLGMDTSVFLDVKFFSILVGWMTSFGFLLTVLTVQLVRVILSRCGVDCPSIIDHYRTRRIRAFFDNMDRHKNSQLEWLRENYNMQAKRIKDNCISQLERIRESYTTQTKNLSDIRDYGAQQISTMRDQYHDQIRRVSTYSTHQLCKVRENYVFQRNRVGKFSSHQMLRLRETYKWQAQTLNKILENLPKTLNFDTCRGIGASGRTDSIYMDDATEPNPDTMLLDPSQLRMGDGAVYSKSKLEHVSLLIPPEFFLVGPQECSHVLAIPMVDCINFAPIAELGQGEGEIERPGCSKNLNFNADIA